MIIMLSIISELIMALITLYSTSMLGEGNCEIKRCRFIISLLCVVAISICFNSMVSAPSTFLKVVVFPLNYLKFVVMAAVLYRKISIKMICLNLILDSLCSLCKEGISFFVPIEQAAVTFQGELSLLCVRTVIMIIILLLRRKSQKCYSETLLAIIPNYIYILVWVNVLLADGLITAISYRFPNEHSKDMTVAVIAIALSLGVFATLFSLLFSVVSKKYFTDINKLLEKQIATQISYYEDREKSYAGIRRFRHDYINHINCIRSLLKAERYDEIQEYLGNITTTFPSNKLLFNTGNFITDAILSDKQSSIKEESIILKFDGNIPTLINETDLCIILGNAVDNAIEACRTLDGEKTISIYSGFDHGYFILTVTNPTAVCEKPSGILPFTTKTDKSEHGFGLLNIKSVVDKYNGYMKIENKDNVFTLSLTFNSAVPECKVS